MKKNLIFILLLLTACTKNVKPELGNYLNYSQTFFEYGENIYLSDILENKDVIYDDQKIDTLSLGKNDININYELDNQKYYDIFSYEIVDTTKPLVWLSSSYTVTKGYNENLVDNIICADNADRDVDCKIVGDYDLNTIGKYNLTFIAEDDSKNTEEIDFVLNVIEKNSSRQNNNSKTLFEDVYNQYKNENTMIGIDVSKYQGDINWEKVKNAGAEFVMIRLGYQYYFGEKLSLDPYFIQNIEGALASDLKVGIYFYSYAVNEKEAINQAKFVLDNIKNYNVTMPISFDWENYSHWNELNINLFDLNNTLLAFNNIIKNAGYTPVNYGSKNYLNAFWFENEYDTWLAHYISGKSDYDKPYLMWQLCNNGIIDGINGYVDINVYYKN